MAYYKSGGSTGLPVNQPSTRPVRSRSATIFSAVHPASMSHYGVVNLPGAVPSNTVTPSGKGTMSCPNLLFVRHEPTEIDFEFHRKLKLTESLSDASQRLARTEVYSRHRLSDSSSPYSPRSPCSEDDMSRRRCISSSVSSIRSSSEIDTVSCDESTELDISKVIPEIRIDELESRAPFSDRNAAEIVDFLFIGDLDSAFREPLLCRLNIECIVEFISLTPQEVRKTVKLKDCPCVCASQTKHSRIRLNLSIDDSIQEDIVHYFDEVNHFIHGAYKSRKNILLYCLKGNTISPTIAIQYLMQYQGLKLKDAYVLVKERRSQVAIPEAFQRVLIRLERQLRPTSPTGFIFEGEKKQCRAAPTPEAWT